LLRAAPVSAAPAESLTSLIRVWNFTALGRDQKLFPHFGETGMAIFAVKQVK
jgi:hypothetical protein